MKILPMLVTVKVSLWSGAVLQEQKFLKAKGIFQKLLSGFFPLRGGYPRFPLSFFGHTVFPLRGGSTPQFRKGKNPLKTAISG